MEYNQPYILSHFASLNVCISLDVYLFPPFQMFHSPNKNCHVFNPRVIYTTKVPPHHHHHSSPQPP